MVAYTRITEHHPVPFSEHILISFDLIVYPDQNYSTIMSYSGSSVIDWAGATQISISYPIWSLAPTQYSQSYMGSGTYTNPGIYLINYSITGNFTESGPGFPLISIPFNISGFYRVDIPGPYYPPVAVPGPIIGTGISGLALTIVAIMLRRYFQPIVAMGGYLR